MDVPIRLLRERSSAPIDHNDLVASVRAAPGYFTAEECDRILELGAAAPQISGKVGEALGQVDAIRRSRVTAIYPGADTDWLFDKLEVALQQLNRGYGYRLDGFMEGAQVAWYEDHGDGRGGHYDWHIDLGPGRYSLRKLSMSVQLSDPEDYDGGDLEFMASDEAGIRTRGSMIVFPSFLEHRVCPVTRGTRASMVSWIAGDPFR
jgi:PKHD-type hydroxylase